MLKKIYFLKFLSLSLIALLSAALTINPAAAAPKIGQMAPDFEAVDIISGQTFKFSDHKGKIIILEWTNHLCPFVNKHYETGNMQKTQKIAREQGALWVSIVSSSKDRQGYTSPQEALDIIKEEKANPSVKILDPSGKIGYRYKARTTPHMFIIDKSGKLAYAGAIDDNSSVRHETIESAQNYVLSALSDLTNGRAVQTPLTNPYGCSVKYAR